VRGCVRCSGAVPRHPPAKPIAHNTLSCPTQKAAPAPSTKAQMADMLAAGEAKVIPARSPLAVLPARRRAGASRPCTPSTAYPPRGCVQVTVPALKAFLAANRSGPLELAPGHFAGLRPAPEQHQTIHPHPDVPRARFPDRFPDRYIEQAPGRRQKGGPARPLSLDPLTPPPPRPGPARRAPAPAPAPALRRAPRAAHAADNVLVGPSAGPRPSPLPPVLTGHASSLLPY